MTDFRYISVCAGIEAATTAWHRLGWRPLWFSEIEPFPCAVLAHLFPDVPNLGDMTKFREWPDRCSCGDRSPHVKQPFTINGKNHQIYACTKCRGVTVRLTIGGTPCQSFSLAGLRLGLADPRGNLALVYLGMVQRYGPRWVGWENVPGVHSSWTDVAEGDRAVSERGRAVVEAARRAALELGLADAFAGIGDGDFAERDQTSDLDGFLAGLAELGYGIAARVLDAQHFGVAQRRRRVFVVGHAGAWQPAAAVLLEPEGLRGDPPPSRGPRKGPPAAPAGGAGGGRVTGAPDVAGTLDRGTPGRSGSQGNYLDQLIPEVAGSVTAQGNGGGSGQDALGMIVPAVAPTLKAGVPAGDQKDMESLLIPTTARALTTKGRMDPTSEELIAGPATAFNWQSGVGISASEEVVPCMIKNQTNAIAYGRPVDTTGHQGDHVVGEGDLAPCLSAQGGNNGGGAGFLLHESQRPTLCVDMGGGKGQANVSEEQAPTLNTSAAGHAIVTPIKMGNSKQNGAHVGEPGSASPTLDTGPVPAVAFKPSHFTRGKDGAPDEIAPPLTAEADKGDQDPVVFQTRVARNGRGGASDVVPALGGADAGATSDMRPCVADPSGEETIVRRLTPLECERLQGFPDNHTLIPGDWRPRDPDDRAETVAYLTAAGLPPAEAEALADCPDGPRYKAIGNSMAVPCMLWIGQRLKAVDDLLYGKDA